MSMSESEAKAAQERRLNGLLKAMQLARKQADDAEQQIRGLGRTPEGMRGKRLKELQQKRRELVLTYYEAKEQWEDLVLFAPKT